MPSLKVGNAVALADDEGFLEVAECRSKFEFRQKGNPLALRPMEQQILNYSISTLSFSLLNSPEIVLEKMVVVLWVKIVLSFDPHQPIALCYQCDVNRPSYGF